MARKPQVTVAVRPRDVYCVTCGAFAGARCITGNGRYVRGNHPARAQVAADWTLHGIPAR